MLNLETVPSKKDQIGGFFSLEVHLRNGRSGPLFARRNPFAVLVYSFVSECAYLYICNPQTGRWGKQERLECV